MWTGLARRRSSRVSESSTQSPNRYLIPALAEKSGDSLGLPNDFRQLLPDRDYCARGPGRRASLALRKEALRGGEKGARRSQLASLLALFWGSTRKALAGGGCSGSTYWISLARAVHSSGFYRILDPRLGSHTPLGHHARSGRRALVHGPGWRGRCRPDRDVRSHKLIRRRFHVGDRRRFRRCPLVRLGRWT